MSKSTTPRLKVITRIMILLVISAAVLMSNAVLAQRRVAQKMYYGVEGTIGTRSFKLNSDIADLNKVKPFFSGQNFGVIFGNEKIHAKIRQGYFKTEASAPQKFKMIETEGVVNLYPFQFAKKKFRYFEPYFLTGVNRSNVKFFGNYVSTEKKVAETVTGTNVNSTPKTITDPTEGTLICCCTDDGVMPANPYQLVSVQSTPSANPTSVESAFKNDLTAGPQETIIDETTTESFLGKIMVTRATIGFGLEAHVPGANHFINLFAEVKYGFALSTSSNDTAFKGTRASGQMAVNFGFSFGLSK